MTDAESAPQFIAPAKLPAARADRAKALAMALGTLLIATIGLAEVKHILDAIPAESGDLFCIDDFAVYGLPATYEHAILWVVAMVWLGFGALALVTYTRTNLWRWVTAASATGLFIVGASSSFVIVAAESCW
jgi:hypothetical protein